jgi:hypothetical protein
LQIGNETYSLSALHPYMDLDVEEDEHHDNSDHGYKFDFDSDTDSDSDSDSEEEFEEFKVVEFEDENMQEPTEYPAQPAR